MQTSIIVLKSFTQNKKDRENREKKKSERDESNQQKMIASDTVNETSPLLDKPQRSSWHLSTKTAGLLVLFALIWSWVLQAEASQALQAKMKFDKPFFLVCFNHTATGILLPIVFIYHKITGGQAERATRFDFVSLLKRHSVIPLGQLARIAFFLSSYYCVADYFWYAALTNVSVAAGTAIFNCSPLFVYCFSICFLRESVTVIKIAGVLTSFIGVTMVVIFQNQDTLDMSDLASVESSGLVAGLLVLISAACYAGYEVGLRLAVGENITDTSTLFILAGLSGLLTIPFWILGSFVLAGSPFPTLYEPLGWPTTSDGLATLIGSGSLAVIFNVCLPLSLCWTSPLETSVGCMLTIPLAGILDAVFHHTQFSWECIVGSIMVMTGFGILEYGSPAQTTPNIAPNRIDSTVV